MTSKPARLTFPAPRRCADASASVITLPKKKGEKGAPISVRAWSDHPWTAADVAAAQLAGARFVSGRHDFADKDAERAAGVRAVRGADALQRWLKRLSPSQLEILKHELGKEVG